MDTPMPAATAATACTTAPRTRRRAPARERLLAMTRIEANDCVSFTGFIHKRTGYGTFTFARGRTTSAHRAAYELLVGPIPDGMFIDHTCHNADATCAGGITCLHRRCVNPAHLEAVTPQENLLRSVMTLASLNARKTHCANGHEYSADNTYTAPVRPTERYCRECHREHNERRRVRQGGAGR